MFLTLSDIHGLLHQLCHEHFTRVAHPRDSYIAWVVSIPILQKNKVTHGGGARVLHRHLRSRRCQWPNPA